ncbi:MAG: response regulator [Burkholderiales bacterium]|nr:response regulator [Burkholderiales bacterium]
MQEPSGLNAGQSEVDALRAELARREQEFELLARRLAHDVQGMLQNIEGFAGALRSRAADRLDERDRHYLDRIAANALKGNALVNDLLQYHRLASHPIDEADVSLPALLRRVAQRLEQEHAATPVPLHFAGEEDRLQGDAALLEHALHALVSNAIRFSAGAADPRIEVRCERRGGFCELSVADRGMGFDPAEAGRLFEPFVRLQAADAHPGNGMGLAIVKRIAERHGGSVRAVGAPGRGATFTLSLPGVRAHAPAAQAVPQGPGALRILLVDDDALVLASLGSMLERAGHHVTSVSGGQQALAAFEQALDTQPFDAVVTDWGMPQVGGGRIAQVVKQLRPATRVVVLSGLPPEGIRGETASVDAVLAKPVRLAQMRALFPGTGPQPGDRG